MKFRIFPLRNRLGDMVWYVQIDKGRNYPFYISAHISPDRAMKAVRRIHKNVPGPMRVKLVHKKLDRVPIPAVEIGTGGRGIMHPIRAKKPSYPEH